MGRLLCVRGDRVDMSADGAAARVEDAEADAARIASKFVRGDAGWKGPE